MKKMIKWLAKIFKVELPQKIVIKKVVEMVIKNHYDGDTVDGNLTVNGNLTVKGYCNVTGDLTVFKIK